MTRQFIAIKIIQIQLELQTEIQKTLDNANNKLQNTIEYLNGDSFYWTRSLEFRVWKWLTDFIYWNKFLWRWFFGIALLIYVKNEFSDAVWSLIGFYILLLVVSLIKANCSRLEEYADEKIES